jgi:acetylornithine deacetylase/succinyl-diaminopimelate desuccinylase-like protein
MTRISSNGLRLTTLFIAGSLLLSSLTGCGRYKEWKQKEEPRLMRTTREAIARELAERKAEKEANKNWLQRHWTGVSIGTLATWAVGITAFMIFKWPKDGKQGKQGIPGSRGLEGKPGKDAEAVIPQEVQSQIDLNTVASQQAYELAEGLKSRVAQTEGKIQKVEDDVAQIVEFVAPLQDRVDNQGKAINRVSELAQNANRRAETAANISASAFSTVSPVVAELDAHHSRIEALEKAAKK